MQFVSWAVRMPATFFFLVSLSGISAAQSSGQQNLAPIPQASSGCELHVWPSAGLRSIYHGWMHGGIVDGAIKGRDGYPEVPADPLATTQQADLMRAIGLADVFALSGYAVIVHQETQSSVTLRQTSTRIFASTSPCYAELFLEDNFFQEDIVNGASLKTLIRFRNFGSAERYSRQFGTWTRTPLAIFPPKTPSLNEAALTELQNALRSNIAQFAKTLSASSEGKKRK